MRRGLPDPNFWRGRRVLLTGHTGFKGAWAALWLTRMGARVTGLALPPDTTPSLFDLAKVGALVESHEGDIRDPVTCHAIAACAEPEIIVHMAAQALVRRSYREPADTFDSNVMGTVNVLQAALTVPRLKACLVVTSDKVYEHDGTAKAFAEGDRLGGHDPYSASKAAAEIATHSYRQSFFEGGKARLATARGGNVIGGGDFSEDRIVPDVWRAHLAREPVILRYPDATRPWQHVLDCLSGYLVFAQRLAEGSVADAALNIGPRETKGRTVRDLVAAVQAALGAKQGWQQAKGPQQREMPTLALSCERAERALGWRSRLDADGAIAWTADWYKAFAAGEDAQAISLRQIERYEAQGA
jgi:CDP-glucose 4,6-dehydratase